MFAILTFIQLVSQCNFPEHTVNNGKRHLPLLMQQRQQYGFTLIEIMVVVIILGILAAIVAPNVIGRVDDAQITKAKTEIRNLESSMKFYRLDNFAYPTTEQGIDALANKPADPNVKNWNTGGYIPRVPKDPWGNEYLYLNPGTNGEIDIYTLGRDGQPGGEGVDADIGNWNLD
jgi:general secretion pathway protein G